MTTFTKITDLPAASSLTDSDKFIVETSTGTKSVTRSALREEVTVTKSSIGLGNVDNTSDLSKPISNAMASALLGKVSTSDLQTTLADFLSKIDAASTYLTQNNASGTYLSKTDAAIYYLSTTDAGSVYATKTEVGSMLPSATAATVYATKTEALQNVTTNTISALTTTAKTVSGAINELNSIIGDATTALASL